MTESRLTQRLVGAIVLVALMVIFVPLLFEKEDPTPTIELPPVPPSPPQPHVPEHPDTASLLAKSAHLLRPDELWDAANL